LNEGIVNGLNKLGVNAEARPSGVFISNRRISEALPLWFYNFLLFQGTLQINTELDVYRQVIRAENGSEERNDLTSLRQELNREIQMDEVKQALMQGIAKKLEVTFEKSDLTDEERKSAEKLQRIKYSVDSWNVASQEPFLLGMGKTTVEILVAYTPTSMCRKLIELVNNTTSDLQSDIEIRIWMKGRGPLQHGINPDMPTTLRSTEKQNVIPAIIINGERKFSQSIPSAENLRKLS
jgi:hypothetical protein